MSISIPTQVLAEALHQKIKGRRVNVAVFTTFTFDPGFFEKEILPILFDQSFSHVPKVRLWQLEEALRSVQHLAVYFDRSNLVDNDPPKLDVKRFPMSRTKGCFHPKLALILVEDAKNGPASQSLLVGVFSANLTQSGWWENLECGEILEAAEGKPCSFKNDLLGICELLRSCDTAGRDHDALDEIQKFVKQLAQTTQRSSNRTIHPRLFYGKEYNEENKTFGKFLKSHFQLPSGVYNLEVISPYFESSKSPTALSQLIEDIEPKETRIFLPTNDAGAALCTEKYYQAVPPQVTWGRLPSQLLRRAAAAGDQDAKRFVHAKVYRLWSRSEGREYLVVGSPNMTLAAHSTSKSGNVEVAVLIDLGPDRRPSFWLDKIGDTPVIFGNPEETSGEVEEPEVPPISIRYDWKSEKAEYFWESSSPPESVELSFGGVVQMVLRAIVARQWQIMTDKEGETLQRLLNSTAFLCATSSDGKSGMVMVEEHGMESKPTLLSEFTASQILRYWSLLTPEQRVEPPEPIGPTGGNGIPTTTTPPQKVESFFDHFAGIFHGFAKLEKHVENAITSGNSKEAVYRLFGKKYDSLHTLISKLNNPSKDTQPDGTEAKEYDLVARYVALLTAKQLLDRLQKRGKMLDSKKAKQWEALDPKKAKQWEALDSKKAKQWKAFIAEHRQEFRELKGELKSIARIRKLFTFDNATERKKFFDWFQSLFLKDMPPTEGA